MAACQREGAPSQATTSSGSSERTRALEGKAPTRVASRTVLSDEILWALGPAARGRVVGLSPLVDDPRYSQVAGRWPEATPRLGTNPEELLALAPELVILASFSDPVYRAAVEDHVTLLTLDDFSGFDGYRDNLAQIGAALVLEDEAAELRERFDGRVAALEARRPPPAARPSVLCWSAVMVPGASTTFDDAATAAGFRNLAASEGIEGHQRVDVEQVVSWNPTWLVISCEERGCADAREALADQPGLRHMAAVTAGRVIPVEAPVLASVGEGMLALAEQLQAALLDAPPEPGSGSGSGSGSAADEAADAEADQG
nr:ABC transporter substrate-binding protein [Pseudenhygromyxa sp. WMMC2535]